MVREREPSSGDGARFAGINSLRALAVIAVVMYHVAVVFPPPAYAWLRHFHAGVSLFFVLSGFLLFRPFAEALPSGTVNTARYALNRVLRILPAYYVATLVVFWTQTGARDVGRLWRNLTFTTVYRGLPDSILLGSWSLDAEVLFYVFLPLLFVACRALPVRSRLPIATVVVCVLGAASIAYQASLGLTFPAANRIAQHGPTPYYQVLAKFQLFAFGMLVAVLHVRRPQLTLRAPVRALVLVVAAAAALIGVVGFLQVPGLGDPAMGIAFSLLLTTVLFLPGRSWGRRVLTTAPLVFIGEVSYGVYLWHGALLVALVRMHLAASNGPLLLLELLSVSIAVAALSYHVVERPALRLKSLWAKAPAARAELAAA